MSNSRKKVPITGITTARSDKPFILGGLALGAGVSALGQPLAGLLVAARGRHQ
jgi:hypothetical protein